MDEQQEYPALRSLLAELAADLYNWQKAVERDKWDVKTDASVSLARLATAEARYSQLERVLRRLEHTNEARIGVTWHTLLTVGIVNGGFMALIVYLLFLQH